jgi:hypothetical protein
MRKRRLLLGQMVIDTETPIELFVELPIADTTEKAAVLKDRLACLLDTRFRPSNPEPLKPSRLIVEEVASLLSCHCRTVLWLVKRGDLHPTIGEDGELYFDRAEVANVSHVPSNNSVYRIFPKK